MSKYEKSHPYFLARNLKLFCKYWNLLEKKNVKVFPKVMQSSRKYCKLVSVPGKRSLGACFLLRDRPFPGMDGHIFEHDPDMEVHQEAQPEKEVDLDRPEIDGEDSRRL
jgi:hypothetical protein